LERYFYIVFFFYRKPNVSPPETFRFGSLHVGGIPPGHAVPLSEVAVSDGFTGCIADVTFNSVRLNFANVTKGDAAIIGKCADPDQVAPPPIG